MDLFFEDFPSLLQGMIIILIIYHTSSFFFTRDKSFIIYSIYLFLIIVYLIPKTNNATSLYLRQAYLPFFIVTNWIIQIWYWIVYSWFCIYFLNLRIKNNKLSRKIKIYIAVNFIISNGFFLIDWIFFNGSYILKYFIFVFTPISLIIIPFFLIVIYRFPDRINKFFVIGLVSFLFFSIISLIFSVLDIAPIPFLDPIRYFMIGIFIEAITISIGLGYKYHNYLTEKNNYNSLLIKELKKTKDLEEQLNQKLTLEIEVHKLDALKAVYKKEINDLKLTSLLNQMNPHFIFNALNSIKLYIINNEPKVAAHFINKFSKLIRKILEASYKKEISLREELETMNLYMTIENIRFSNEINFQIEISEQVQLDVMKIPPLILQPFLENAIWHGLSSVKGNKKIKIIIEKVDNSFLQIIIEDNGIGREASEKIKSEKIITRKSLGINLTKDRLQFFTKDLSDKFSIVYEDLKNDYGQACGTKVILNIPLI